MDLSFRHFAGVGNGYQSGTELPHSKGCRHLNLLIAFGFNLHRPQLIGLISNGQRETGAEEEQNE